jgi:hypothetical protein
MTHNLSVERDAAKARRPSLLRYAYGGYMKLFVLLLSGFLALPSVCFAELADENLLQNLPNGYKVDFQAKQGNMVITEMVPQSETVKNWTEMVTTQIFLGLKNATPEQFQAFMAKSWLAACKDGGVAPITKGEENGYPFSIWLQTCPLNQSTGKPEKTWFKAIKGNDSFYVVQKAFRFDPSNEQVVQWMKYFRSVIVCDSRLPDRPCPKLEKVAQ